MKNKKIVSLLVMTSSLILSACSGTNVFKSSSNETPFPSSSSEAPSSSSEAPSSSSLKPSSSSIHVHSFSQWSVVNDATCTKSGQRKRTCSVCNYEELEIIRAYGHDWIDVPQAEDTNYVAPQVGVKGKRTQKCARCQNEQIVEIAALDPVDPSTISSVPDNDMRNLQQYKYLMDEEVGHYKTYATGADLSAPRGMKLAFDNVSSASKYYVQVAESEAGLNSATIREAANKYYMFQNAKLATKYYYRAATSQAGLATAKVYDITSTDISPRVVYVPNVLNFRDIGGWESSLVAGAKINQGLYFRCAQLDKGSASNTTSKLDSNGLGKAALKELGIKVDIDMRDGYNFPGSVGNRVSAANSTDWPVSFVGAPVPSGSENQRWEGGNWTGDDGNGNSRANISIAAQYKLIFETIAHCNTAPVMLHCTYGADRTGITTFFLEALLGMSIKDMTRDYLWTQFTQGRTVKYTESDAEFPKWISKTNNCQGDTFADKMENHLMSFGIAKSTLEHIREIFVPGYVAKV